MWEIIQKWTDVLNTHVNENVFRHMKTPSKGRELGYFQDSNWDISGSRRARTMVESALESWCFIFFDGRNFDDRRIFYADPQMKMWNSWILWKMRKITKNGQFSKIGRVKADIFFLEEVFDDSLWKNGLLTHCWPFGRNFWGQSGQTHNRKSRKSQKLTFS